MMNRKYASWLEGITSYEMISLYCGMMISRLSSSTASLLPCIPSHTRTSQYALDASECSRRLRAPQGASRPHARDRRAARRAGPRRGDAVLQHVEPLPPDQRRLTGGAARVFPVFGMAGPVPGVDVAQPGLHANLGGPHERVGGRRATICHFVCRVEARHVPGDVRRHRADEPRRVPQFVAAVVHAGDDECDVLQPQAEVMHALDGIQHVLEHAADDLAV